MEAPEEWPKVLILLCDLLEKSGKDIIPSIDHDRIRYFVRFWQDVEEIQQKEHRWMIDVCERFDKIYKANPVKMEERPKI